VTEEQFLFWFRIFQAIALPLLSYVAYTVRGIHIEFRKLNGRMIRQEEWHLQHDKQDDKRHDEVRAYVKSVEDRLDRMHGNAGRL